MATQRHSAVKPVLTVQADFARSQVVAPSQQDLYTVVEEVAIEKGNGTVLVAGDEAARRELDREAKRRAAFDKVSNKIYKVPDYYRKVEVLIIRWEESFDEFKQHNAEIERLQGIFSLGYNYECRVVQITPGPKAQIDLDFEILKHVHDHDGDDTLLIVYYTGHGNHIVDKDGCHHLNLSASRDGTTATAYWDIAEEPLRTKAACDVLAILDCCFASAAALKGVDDKFRTYQLLAASPADGVTNGPGKSSFTNALCDALEVLLKELDGSAFPVLELFQRINVLRPSRPALLWDRLKHGNGRSVNLGRLEQKLKRPVLALEDDCERASLLLRLSLKKKDLELDDITSLARRLPATCRLANIPVRKIEWMEMKQRDPSRIIQDVVRAFKSRTNCRPAKLSTKFSGTAGSIRRASSSASLRPYEAYSAQRRASQSGLGGRKRGSLRSCKIISKVHDETAPLERAPLSVFAFCAVVMAFSFLVVPFSFEDRLITVLVLMGVSVSMCHFRSNADSSLGQRELIETSANPLAFERQILPRSSTWPFE